MGLKDFLFVQPPPRYEYCGESLTADEVLAAMRAQGLARGGTVSFRVVADDDESSAQPHDEYASSFSVDSSHLEPLVEYDYSSREVQSGGGGFLGWVFGR